MTSSLRFERFPGAKQMPKKQEWLIANVSAYCSCQICTEENSPEVGGHGLTAAGTEPLPGNTCAADWRVFPKGTLLDIEGVGVRIVTDRGGAIRENRLDLYMSSHDEALRFGRKMLRVRRLA